MHRYHLSRVSLNRKTGPIPVSTTSRDSCPDDCPLKDNGCYGENHPLRYHWDAVDSGKRGLDLSLFCRELETLYKRQLWRYAQVGDLPGDGKRINRAEIEQIAEAASHTEPFCYTHYSPFDAHNASVIRDLNARGFTVNLSADNLAEADAMQELGIGPVAVVLPADATKPLKTPAGNHVAICPASVRDDITCANCGICAVAHRKAIIGFPAHGVQAKKAERVFWMQSA